MNLKLKEKILLILAILNTFIFGISLINNIINGSNSAIIIYNLLNIFISIFLYYFINYLKKDNNLCLTGLIFAINGYLSLTISSFIINVIGIIISLIETNEEKGKISLILKKYPIISSLAIILMGISFLNVSSVLEYFSDLTYGFEMLGELVCCLFLFFLFVVCNKKDVIVKNKLYMRETIFVILPFIVYIIYIAATFLSLYLAEGYHFVSIDNMIVIVLLYILVGIFEDFLLRGLTLNVLLDKYGKTKKGIWLSVIVSSFLFGIIHFSNLFTGASFQGVLIQVISASFIGMYFSAIYLRCGSVWVVALLHGVYDLVASIPSLFVVQEVVDPTLEYAQSISNYSWIGALFALIYVIFALFLLRRKKMENVFAIRERKEILYDNNKVVYGNVLLAFVIGFTALVCNSIFVSMFNINKITNNAYKKILKSSDYQENYGLTYINNKVEYSNMSNELKLLLAVNNLEDDDFVNSYSIKSAEEKVNDESILTYIKKEEINESLKEIFGENDNIDFVDFNVSYKTSCHFQDDSNLYECITNNNTDNNGLKVYTNIYSMNFEDVYNAELLVYYIVEDTKTHNLYADSNLQSVYKYNTSIEDLVGNIEYNSNSDNREFWNAIKEKNNNLIPTYCITFEISDQLDNAYFKSSEFIKDSINSTEDNDKQKKYTFVYDKEFFTLNEDEDSSVLINDNETYFEIRTIESNEWLDKYKNNNGNNVTIGNYTYYNYNNEFLIYTNDFYIISIKNSEDTLINDSIYKILESLKFY